MTEVDRLWMAGEFSVMSLAVLRIMRLHQKGQTRMRGYR
jgi:hypothetical protein